MSVFFSSRYDVLYTVSFSLLDSYVRAICEGLVHLLRDLMVERKTERVMVWT